MRSGVVVITTFMCCFLALICIMTIGNYNLQRDELERAIALTAEQTLRRCEAEGITDENEIASVATETFSSLINSKKGTLHFYVLYADKNAIDIAAEFSYKQYNGTQKNLSFRKTCIIDWEEGLEEDAKMRFVSDACLVESAENGGLKDNSVWKSEGVLADILNNQKNSDEWNDYVSCAELKCQ